MRGQNFIKIVSWFVSLIIMALGFFKEPISAFFSRVFENVALFFGYSVENIFLIMNDFRTSDDVKNNITGWLFYFPLYISLHYLLIILLFYNNKKVLKLLVLSLTSVLILTLSTAVIGKKWDIEFLHAFGYSLFQKLIGLPFILLFIEGGKILYNDIKNRIYSER